MASRTVFVISPIGSPGTPEHRRSWLTLEYVIKKAFPGDEWEVVRADEETSPDSITTQVIARIIDADIIIADLTDHNPNVFYELAVAHGYKKSVVHLMQEGQKVPFDVVDQRVIFYDLADPESVDKATNALRRSVTWLEENPGQSRNPLSAYGQFEAISSATSGGGEAVAEAIESLARRVARMDMRIREELPRRDFPSTEEEAAARLALLNRRRRHLARRSAEGEDVEEEMRAFYIEERRIIESLEPRKTRESGEEPK